MNIVQFFRIVWAYRMLVLASTLVCFTLATLVVELVTPRYVAQSRVMLDVIKPDPVTGQVIASAFLRAYTKTQIEMVKDEDVARKVVEDLGWARNPQMQRDYRNRKAGRDLDFTHWAAQEITEGADAQLIAGSNILEISYTSESPARAKHVADGLRKAYMDITLESRRDTARRNAAWYENQAEKSKAILFAAESAKANYERANGIILQDDKIDIDSARLRALAAQGSAPVIAAPASGTTPSSTTLAMLDAEINEQTKALGPNHPLLQQLKVRRGVLAAQVEAERKAAASASSASVNASRATAAMLSEQKGKVMGQREKVERLRLMQDEVDLRRDQYNKAVARAAQLRQEAEIADAGVTPLASATTPQSPEFPKKGLTMGASVPLGAGLGILIALLLEVFGRRVRSADDLHSAVDAPVLAVIRSPQARARARRDWSKIWRPAVRRRPQIAQA